MLLFSSFDIIDCSVVFMVGMEAIAISARLYRDVCTGRVEIDPILVNVKIHGKEFCAMNQFAGN